MVTHEDAIYTAGLFDGEGSVSLMIRGAKRGKTGLPTQAPMLVIQLTMTHEQVIEWLVATWQVGSKIATDRKLRPNHKPAYRWQVWGAAAALVLEQIAPFLIVKRQQALLGIAYRELAGIPGRKLGEETMRQRLALRDQMIALNGNRGSLSFPS